MRKKPTHVYDKGNHELLDRREFLKKVSVLAGGVAAANALLPLLGTNRAKAEVIPKDDPRLVTDLITYPGPTGDLRASLARPKGDAKLPVVLIIHDHRGLTPHTEDVARRVALEGFLAMAPDALSLLGGTPSDGNKAIKLIEQMDGKSTVNNYLAAVKYLKTHPASTGRVGVVGFCWGGAVANQLAVNSTDVSAVVAFYGAQPASEDVPKIKASLLLHYGSLDEKINKGIPAYDAALKKASIDYKSYMYEGGKHAFFDDTNAAYNKDAAQLAWTRTIAFLNEKLKT